MHCVAGGRLTDHPLIDWNGDAFVTTVFGHDSPSKLEPSSRHMEAMTHDERRGSRQGPLRLLDTYGLADSPRDHLVRKARASPRLERGPRNEGKS